MIGFNESVNLYEVVEQKNSTNYISLSGEPYKPSDGPPIFHKQVVEEIISELNNAKKAPRYKPFPNRTKLRCDDFHAKGLP